MYKANVKTGSRYAIIVPSCFFSRLGPKSSLSTEATFLKIYDSLKLNYGSAILAKDDLQWFTLSAGGSISSVCILYASITEYILFVGSPLGSTGHSGYKRIEITTCSHYAIACCYLPNFIFRPKLGKRYFYGCQRRNASMARRHFKE